MARSTTAALAEDVPPVVAEGRAVLVRPHDRQALLRLNVGLAVRDSNGLDAFIRAASTPRTPAYGHYLTRAQYRARYAPTDASASAARAWLTAHGLRVIGVSSDNLLVKVSGRAAAVERAFGVRINDYRSRRRSFYANDRAPRVPSALHVHWISGLSTFNVYRSFDTTARGRAEAALTPGQLRQAYDVTHDGSGLTIGFTVWGRALPQSDFDGYASATGTAPIEVGQAGDNGLDWVKIDGQFGNGSQDLEVAADTEVAHAVAPGAHLTYFLGADSGDSTMEDVLSAAANSGIDVISSSWACEVGLGCSPDRNMDPILQQAAAAGTNWFFGSGDSGANGESYPASSPYVVAVGGTTLNLDGNGNYVSEVVWPSGGAGCGGNNEPFPLWQGGINAPHCIGGRAFPDVSADSGTSVFVFFDGGSGTVGGTSVSTPLWAGFVTTWNRNNVQSVRPKVGFLPPLLYQLAEDVHASKDFHDVTAGSNGRSAAPGWDEATGWGSADVDRLANNLADMSYFGDTSANDGDTVALRASLTEHFVQGDNGFVALGGRQVFFGAAGGENCDGVTNNSGTVECFVTIDAATDPPGRYKVIAAFAGDEAYKAASVTENFTVNGIPTKLTYTGPTKADYDDPTTLTAKLLDDSSPLSLSSGDPIQGEPIHFHAGGENCSDTTNANGVASCTITPLDDPGGSPYAISVGFGGDSPTYLSEVDATQGLTVQKEETTASFSPPLPTTILYGSDLVLAGTLTEDTSPALAGKTLTFTIGSGPGAQSCTTQPTDGGGHAGCTITNVQQPEGSQPLTVDFAGDGFYRASSAPITIVVYSAQSNVKTTLAQVDALLPQATNPDRAKLSDIARKLADALDPSNWGTDGNHLQPRRGEHVFADEKDGLTKLLEVLKSATIPASAIQPLVDKLIQAAEIVADTAVADAIAGGGNPMKIAQAQDERAKADQFFAAGKPQPAMDHLANAWHRAQEALRLL